MTRLILFFVLCHISLQAQIDNSKQNTVTKTYYWFYLKLGKAPSKSTGMDRIFIKTISSSVKSGSFNQFIKAHQDGLLTGKITIGPFLEDYQVKHAQLLYKYAGKNVRIPGTQSKGADEEEEFSFFYLKPHIFNESQEIFLEPIPSRVTTGTQNNFVDMLSEGLNFEQLAVGPSPTYELSEMSKFAYGKIPGSEPAAEIDSLAHLKMVNMARQWKSLKWKIVRKADNSDTKNYLYRFSTKIGRRYFAPNAIQVVTIKAAYSESYQGRTNSFTLQGDQVTDNNYVVSSKMSTVYIKTLYFERGGKEKINGFWLESFIYNNTELIELEPVYIKLK